MPLAASISLELHLMMTLEWSFTIVIFLYYRPQMSLSKSKWHLYQLKTVVFLHLCLMHAVLLKIIVTWIISNTFNLLCTASLFWYLWKRHVVVIQFFTNMYRQISSLKSLFKFYWQREFSNFPEWRFQKEQIWIRIFL